jgi:hypothetical protein
VFCEVEINNPDPVIDNEPEICALPVNGKAFTAPSTFVPSM